LWEEGKRGREREREYPSRLCAELEAPQGARSHDLSQNQELDTID